MTLKTVCFVFVDILKLPLVSVADCHPDPTKS